MSSRQFWRLKPVPIKSEQHQALQSVYKVRAQSQSGRTTLLNMVRALTAEFGVVLPKNCGESRMHEHVEEVPLLLQAALTDAPDQSAQFKQMIEAIAKTLACQHNQRPNTRLATCFV